MEHFLPVYDFVVCQYKIRLLNVLRYGLTRNNESVELWWIRGGDVASVKTRRPKAHLRGVKMFVADGKVYKPMLHDDAMSSWGLVEAC